MSITSTGIFRSTSCLAIWRPDIKAWRDALSEKYEMEEIIFFADFSNPALRQEIPRIREVSNYIIETQNTSTSFKKDFTDFIMLDHI